MSATRDILQREGRLVRALGRIALSDAPRHSRAQCSSGSPCTQCEAAAALERWLAEARKAQQQHQHHHGAGQILEPVDGELLAWLADPVPSDPEPCPACGGHGMVEHSSPESGPTGNIDPCAVCGGSGKRGTCCDCGRMCGDDPLTVEVAPGQEAQQCHSCGAPACDECGAVLTGEAGYCSACELPWPECEACGASLALADDGTPMPCATCTRAQAT